MIQDGLYQEAVAGAEEVIDSLLGLLDPDLDYALGVSVRVAYTFHRVAGGEDLPLCRGCLGQAVDFYRSVSESLGVDTSSLVSILEVLRTTAPATCADGDVN